jgi:hypothetical protein
METGFSNPPMPADPNYLVRYDPKGREKVEHDLKIWRTWITEHESSLRQVPPTGEGIDFSGRSCKRKANEKK